MLSLAQTQSQVNLEMPGEGGGFGGEDNPPPLGNFRLEFYAEIYVFYLEFAFRHISYPTVGNF